MHSRRRKFFRSVELARGKNGFGFTISGQAPCIFSCIVSNSPAERAQLRPGDFLIAVNGLNISKAPHDDVVRLIGNSTGVLKLQIAENYYSDSSSDDDVLGKAKHRSRHPSKHIYRAEKVVRDLWTGAIFDASDAKPKESLAVKAKEPVFRAVVGYLGTIEIPTFRLGAISNCIRRLRIEKKIHTLVLLSVFSDGILLTDPRGAALATFPASQIAFSGAYADDCKFFGLVTCHRPDAVASSCLSCHVFLVDSKLHSHRAHIRQAKAFHLNCTPQRHLPEECREFPDSADALLTVIAGLFDRSVSRADSLASPPPSNTSSSNSDSGIGFKEEGSDRVVIVDVESYMLGSSNRFRTNSLDRQNLTFPVKDRLTCRTMPDPIRPAIDKLSPKVYQEFPRSIKKGSPYRVEQVAEKWARTASLRRHLPGRKRSVRKTSSEVAGTVSDGELPVPSVTGRERGVDVGRVGSWAGSFELLLKDPAGLENFTDFLKQEFSQENINFWTACEKYRKMTDAQQMTRMAQEIFARFLCPGAPEPVNVDSHAHHVAQEGLVRPTGDIFIPAQKQIFNLMKFDCYQRFLKSGLFKTLLLREMQQPDKHKSLRMIPPVLPWRRSKSKLKRRKKRRAVFRLNLPAGLGVLGIKAPPENSCRETLTPVLLRFGLQIDHWAPHVLPHSRPLDLSHPVSTLDGLTLALSTQGLHFATADIEDGASQLFQHLADGDAHFHLPGDVAIVHFREEAEGSLQQRKEDKHTEDLLDIWKRAQRSRLDDQRGTEINFELPDFLKVASGKENRPSRPPPPLPPKSNGRGPPPRPPNRQPFFISFV